MRKLKLNCPVCDRSDVRYRQVVDDYTCRHCGAVFTVVRTDKGALFKVTRSPTTAAQCFEVSRKWDE